MLPVLLLDEMLSIFFTQSAFHSPLLIILSGLKTLCLIFTFLVQQKPREKGKKHDLSERVEMRAASAPFD